MLLGLSSSRKAVAVEFDGQNCVTFRREGNGIFSVTVKEHGEEEVFEYDNYGVGFRAYSDKQHQLLMRRINKEKMDREGEVV